MLPLVYAVGIITITTIVMIALMCHLASLSRACAGGGLQLFSPDTSTITCGAMPLVGVGPHTCMILGRSSSMLGRARAGDSEDAQVCVLESCAWH